MLFVSMMFTGCDCSPHLARIMFVARARGTKQPVSQVHYAFTASSHVSSFTIHHIKLKPTYTPFLKQPLRIIFPTHPLQEPPILLAITIKRPLPLRAIVQVPPWMARFICCCNDIDLLDSAARRRPDKHVIPTFIPIDHEAYDNERPMGAVVQAKRIRIALAYPVR